MVVSPEILEEYHRVGDILDEDHPNLDLKPVLDYVIQNAEVYAAPALPEAVCEDPDDDKFLACALASESIVIVSGDKHLLKVLAFNTPVKGWPGAFGSRLSDG